MEINTRAAGYAVIGFAVILAIVLVAVKSDLDVRDERLCSDTQALGLDMATCPAHTTNTGWYLMGAFGIAFFILAVGIYLVFMPKKAQNPESRALADIDTSKLDEDEKKVYEMIKAAGGSMFQGDVIKQLGYTKVTVSRLIDKLEMKGIVERKRRGMSNLVVLK
jgi:uncharacterized membrane protein